MDIERNDLARRAAVHAALGDAVRLDVVDRLALGDLSPAELQAALGIGSNLLAHHLRVLEDAGLITRHRSEADRRRSYLRLDRSALPASPLAPDRAVPTAARVLFVCTANSARSHLAAALWRQASAVPATSAGTHPAERIAPGAESVARRHGLELVDASPRALAEVARPGDLVVTVCDRAHEELGAGGIHLSVPDPVVMGTAAAFERAYALLNERIGELAPLIAAA